MADPRSTTARRRRAARRQQNPGGRGLLGELPGRMRHALDHRRLRVRALLVAVPAIVVVASACGSLPSVPNPFAASATPRPTVAVPAQVTPTPRPAPTPVPEAAPEPFEPFWVQNHRITELWSGASSGPDTVSFGATSGQFCSFLVVLPPEGDRLVRPQSLLAGLPLDRRRRRRSGRAARRAPRSQTDGRELHPGHLHRMTRLVGAGFKESGMALALAALALFLPVLRRVINDPIVDGGVEACALWECRSSRRRCWRRFWSSR